MNDLRRAGRPVHPGPPAAERIESVAGPGIALSAVLPAGKTLTEALDETLGPAVAGASIELRGGAFAPMHYLLPAESPDGTRAAWYSPKRRAIGQTWLERASVSWGRRDGSAFLHAHGLWEEADGTRHVGHILGDEAIVAEPVATRVWTSASLALRVQPDAETGFSLFAPEELPPTGTGPTRALQSAGAPSYDRQPPTQPGRLNGRTLLFARLRPEQDVTLAVEALCSRHGISTGYVHGGLGSIAGACFADGRMVRGIPTEFLVMSGEIMPDVAGVRAQLEVALVDVAGRIHQGTLARGRNPVLITVELAVAASRSDIV